MQFEYGVLNLTAVMQRCLSLSRSPAFAPRFRVFAEEGNFRTCGCLCARARVRVYTRRFVARRNLIVRQIQFAGSARSAYETRPFVCTASGRFLRFDEPNVGNFIPALILTLLRMQGAVTVNERCSSSIRVENCQKQRSYDTDTAS